jgi:hypothetical protein
MKKLVCFLLTAIMIMSAVVVVAEEKPKVNKFGWEIPKETIKFTVYCGSDSPDDYAKYSEKMRAYLKENFNVDITLLVYENSSTERLNLMLAANDYPDVIITSVIDSAQWLDQKRAVDLTQYIEGGLTPNLVESYGNYLKRFYSEDGHLYQLGNSWGMSQWADYASQIRYDWYQEIEAPDISTPDKYYDAIKQIIAKHPTNKAGDKVYAFGGYKDDNYTVMRTWLSMWGIKKFWSYNDKNEMTYWPFTDEALEMVKFLNKVNRDGLLDPDIFTMSSEEFGDRVTNERYAAFVGNWWICGMYGHEKWISSYGSDYNENMRYYHVNVAPEGKTAVFNYKNTNGNRVIITDHATNVEGILKWFNFENTDLGTRLAGYGLPNEEGSVWNVNDDGTWEWNESQRELITTDTAKFDWEAMRLLGGQAYFLVSAGVEPLKDGTYYWYDQSNVDKWKKVKDENLKGTFYDSGAFDSIVLPTDTLLPTTKTACQDIAMTALANAIYAESEDAAVETIKKAREDLKAAGIDELTDFYQTQFQSVLSKWGI